MSPAEALAAVRRHATSGRIVISQHALVRMRQRNVSFRDVRRALSAAHTCQPEADKWKVTGPDTDGDGLTCVVMIEDDVLVITVF